MTARASYRPNHLCYDYRRNLAGGMLRINSHTESADGTVDRNGPDVNVHWVPFPDGRKVLCVFETNINAGELSCDWNKAK